MNTDTKHYRQIEGAIHFLTERAADQPTLEDLSNHMRLSEFHCQRLFKRWVGVSPKDFVQSMTHSKAKELLRNDQSILETSLELGLSGPSRLHDLFIRHESMTPGEYKNLGKDLMITWAQFESPLGVMSLARTNRGICSLTFGESKTLARKNIKNQFPLSKLNENPETLRNEASRVIKAISGRGANGFKLQLSGTSFQTKVWEALLNIPFGRVVSYQDVAKSVGKPAATRAVASAIAANKIGLLIPCHRVIRSTGVIGQYRWGPFRKKALLAIEQSAV